MCLCGVRVTCSVIYSIYFVTCHCTCELMLKSGTANQIVTFMFDLYKQTILFKCVIETLHLLNADDRRDHVSRFSVPLSPAPHDLLI